MEAIFKETKRRMAGAIDSLKAELGKVRTGRASVSLLDSIKVDYYGTPTPLKQVANLSVPESRLIVVQPWDQSILREIEKAILRSELGLTPSNDGKLIRISIPLLTEERRRELVKVVRRMAEEHRVSVRNIRRDSNEALKEMQKKKELSEDDLHRGQSEVQKTTTQFIEEVDNLTAKKEQEVMEV